MTRFTNEEKSIISMYDTKDRIRLVIELKAALPYIEDSYTKAAAENIISKLVGMTDEEFADLEV